MKSLLHQSIKKNILNKIEHFQIQNSRKSLQMVAFLKTDLTQKYHFCERGHYIFI